MSSQNLAATQLLAHVLKEARLLLGESPEQVGGSVGIAGRTIRRLENAQIAMPREVTLSVLAAYYSLNADFIRWLIRRSAAGEDLEQEVRAEAEQHDVGEAENVFVLALMLGRLRSATRVASPLPLDDALHEELAGLNDRRKRMLLLFAQELRLAQSEDIRRRSHAA